MSLPAVPRLVGSASARLCVPSTSRAASSLATPAVKRRRIERTATIGDRRTVFGLSPFGGRRRGKKAEPDPAPVLEQDNLFHPLSQSPFADLRERAERIRSAALCPVSLRHDGERRLVNFECPYCGWPTHYSQKEWEEDEQHDRYWPRLREANEDEHDVRSGRRFTEFDMPKPLDQEEAVSLVSWDLFWYTRGFKDMTPREQRHVTKLLTFPMTVASVLHSNSPYTLRNQRLTPEGARSMAAIRYAINKPRGYTPTLAERPTLPIRIIVTGARAESSLDAYFWTQMTTIFPKTAFHVYFVGPEVTYQHGAVPNDELGVPTFTRTVNEFLSLTTLQCRYEDVHDQLAPFDPWYDIFFAFSPGFGFPTPGQRDVVQAATDWREALGQILDTKCALICTGFSPADVERDVLAMDSVDGLDFDWIVSPGENVFKSFKWEVADFDSNWGIWGIRGRNRKLGLPFKGTIIET